MAALRSARLADPTPSPQHTWLFEPVVARSGRPQSGLFVASRSACAILTCLSLFGRSLRGLLSETVNMSHSPVHSPLTPSFIWYRGVGGVVGKWLGSGRARGRPISAFALLGTCGRGVPRQWFSSVCAHCGLCYVGFDVCHVLYDICGVSPGQKSAHSTMYYTLDTSRSHKKKIFLIYLIEYTVLCTAGSLCMCRCT